MTERERARLLELLDQLTQVRLQQKDPDAEALIREAAARQPDAAYLLVQRALLQDIALAQAQERIAQLQRTDASGAAPAHSFLADNAWGRRAAPTGGGASDARAMAPGAGAAAGGSAATAAPGVRAGGLGSFLGPALATAAGVAGGAFLFHGIGQLLGAHHAGAGDRVGMLDDAGLSPISDPGTAARDTDALRDDAARDDVTTERLADAGDLGDAGSFDDGGVVDDGGFDDGGYDT